MTVIIMMIIIITKKMTWIMTNKYDTLIQLCIITNIQIYNFIITILISISKKIY